MLDQDTLEKYEAVQSIANEVLSEIRPFIRTGVSEAEIANACTALMHKKGISETWYYSIPAFVLVGNRTVLSLSGRDYNPSETAIVAEQDLVTIDLSPCHGEIWGDCARSFIIGDNKFQKRMAVGLQMEFYLHERLLTILKPQISFGDIFDIMNEEIVSAGFENLDFKGNLGHTIECRREDRRYIEKGSSTKVCDVNLFTFEPHIRLPNDDYGFKHENIYFIKDSRLLILAASSRPSQTIPALSPAL